MARRKNYRNEWLNACFGSSSGKTINVKFKHHSETDSFPASSLNMLKGDKAVEWITDNETGEILFSRD